MPTPIKATSGYLNRKPVTYREWRNSQLDKTVATIREWLDK